MVYYKQKETLIKRLRHCLKWKPQNKLIVGSVFRCRSLCLSYLRNAVKVQLLFYVVQTPTKAGYSPFQMSRKYPYLSRVFTMKISARDRFTRFGKYHLVLSKGLVREQVINYRQWRNSWGGGGGNCPPPPPPLVELPICRKFSFYRKFGDT